MHAPGLHHRNRNEPVVPVGIDRQAGRQEPLQHLRRIGVREDEGMREEGADWEWVAAKEIEHQCTFSTVSRPPRTERAFAAHSVDSPGGGSIKLRRTTTAPSCALRRTATIRRSPYAGSVPSRMFDRLNPMNEDGGQLSRYAAASAHTSSRFPPPLAGEGR